MALPQHRHSSQGLSPPFALPITADDEGAVGVALAADADAPCVRLEDARLEVRFDGPGVQGFFEGFEGGEFLAQVEGWHCCEGLSLEWGGVVVIDVVWRGVRGYWRGQVRIKRVSGEAA